VEQYVLLRSDEHMQAERALEQRRIPNRDMAPRAGVQPDSNHPILSSAKQLTGSSVTSILARGVRKRLMRLAVIGVPVWMAWACIPLATATSANPVLIGRSGRHNAFVITLKFAGGQKVKTIPAGTYTFVIHDYSRIHNFALGSQSENKRLFTTGIRWIGTKRYTLTLTAGNYAYACSAHYQTMNGTFVVTGP
jgi:plastocyanin